MVTSFPHQPILAVPDDNLPAPFQTAVELPDRGLNREQRVERLLATTVDMVDQLSLADPTARPTAQRVEDIALDHPL